MQLNENIKQLGSTVEYIQNFNYPGLSKNKINISCYVVIVFGWHQHYNIH